MRIGLSSQTMDAEGALLADVLPESREVPEQGGRRQTRTATLDGGASLYDTGVNTSDQTWELRLGLDALERVKHLASTYQRINIATRDGFFEATIPKWRLSESAVIVTISILEQIA